MTVALSVTILPLSAFAHEQHAYRIGNKTYVFTVGSINEPLIVDDKSGLDLTVVEGGGLPTMGPDGDMDGPPAASKPVAGLEKMLKVEMVAGTQKKTMDITPAFGALGSYKTTFFPTVQTTFSYRLFGTLNSVPVDLTFTCNPAGHPMVAEDTTATKISDTVTQLSKSGAFGCPVARADLGFPEQSITTYDLNTKISEAKDAAASSRSKGMAGIVFGVLGLVAGGGALMRRRTH